MVESRPRLSSVLYRDILGRIQSGEYASETRLPSEFELSAQFKVSRPIVREALKRLREEGLIHSRQGAGSFVEKLASPRRSTDTPAPASSDPDTLPAIRSIEDVQKFYEFRLATEGEAAYWAASYRSEAALSAMEAKLDALQEAIRGNEIGVNQDFDFHMAVASASGNKFFVACLLQLKSNLDFIIDLARSFSISVSSEHLQVVQCEHATIFEAIVRRDSDEAMAAMRTHISNAQRRVFVGQE